MPDIVVTTLNAKYAHAAFGLRYLMANLGPLRERWPAMRDLDGVVHTVPNGAIKVASNLTRVWSRINQNVTVAYGTDIDKAIAVVDEVGRQMSSEPEWSRRSREAPRRAPPGAPRGSGPRRGAPGRRPCSSGQPARPGSAPCPRRSVCRRARDPRPTGRRRGRTCRGRLACRRSTGRRTGTRRCSTCSPRTSRRR